MISKIHTLLRLVKYNNFLQKVRNNRRSFDFNADGKFFFFRYSFLVRQPEIQTKNFLTVPTRLDKQFYGNPHTQKR